MTNDSEFQLFIARQAAFDFAQSRMTQAIHAANAAVEKYGEMPGRIMGHAICASCASELAVLLPALREKGEL
jgi:hypothetical protein